MKKRKINLTKIDIQQYSNSWSLPRGVDDGVLAAGSVV